MEARSAFKGAGVSKTFIAAVLVVVAIGLGVMGAYFASNLRGSKAAAPSQTIQVPVSGSFHAPRAHGRNPQLGNSQPAPARAPRVL